MLASTAYASFLVTDNNKLWKKKITSLCDGFLLCEAGVDRGGYPLLEEAHPLRRGDYKGVVRRLPPGTMQWLNKSTKLCVQGQEKKKNLPQTLKNSWRQSMEMEQVTYFQQI